MNKLLLTLAVVCTVFIANAQRYSDISIDLKEPNNNHLISDDDYINVGFYIRNAGPDTIRSLDTVKLSMTVNGIHIPFYISTQPLIQDSFQYFTQMTIAPGDSVYKFFPPMQVTLGNGNKNFCLKVQPYSSIDSIVDTAAMNNTGCANIIIAPVGVHTVAKQDISVRVYPNPASSMVSFDVVAKDNADVVVSLSDITGRVVAQQHSIVTQGNKQTINLDVSGFAKGVYHYTVFDGTGTSSGKLYLD